MSSFTAVNRHEPWFNISLEVKSDAVFSYVEGDEVISWRPHPELPDGIRNPLIDAVGCLPRKWLMPPKNGEVFDTFLAGQERVLGYSLAAGFQIVGGQGSTKVRKNIWCIHHGERTRNNRKLSERVEKDPITKEIISTRRRDDTGKNGKNCLWRCYLVPLEEIDDADGVIHRWVLRYGKNQTTSLPTDSHSHSFAEDPFVYIRHRNAQPQFRNALPQAVSMRNAKLSFRQAERVLWGQDLAIDRASYYNLARIEAMEISPNGLLSLVTVLERDSWVYRTFWEYTRDPQGTVTQRVLKAVFFTNDDLIKLARKFCPDWMIQVDGTFNTNVIRMPLIDCLGVNNTGKSFLFAFCFVTSESSENWRFVLDCVGRVVFDELPLPRVVIADQGMGLRACFRDIWPHCLLQFCEWHAADNIRKRLANQRYKKEERKVIMDLVWIYIWSPSVCELEINRTAMMAAMRPGEQRYIDTHWRPKERQVIRAYTSLNANLNCFSSQRDEGQHPVIKTVLNPQIRLDQAVQALANEMKRTVERLFKAEQIDKVKNRRMLEQNVWFEVRDKVANWPLLKVEQEWAQLARIKVSNQPLDDDCQCRMVERFGLPCQHHLEFAWDHSIPIPLTLIHSRWWYQGGIEDRSNWTPTYAGTAIGSLVQRQVDRPRHEIVDSTNRLLEWRETLNREQQEQLDDEHARATAQVITNAQHRQYWSTAVPSVLPTLIESTWNRHAKSHDKTMKRMMTGREAAERDADKAEAAQIEGREREGSSYRRRDAGRCRLREGGQQ